jgi:hypothetical protein
MWDIIKNALSYFSSENDKPKSKRNPIKLTPLNLKEYAKQEDQKLTAKQDATAFRSPTKPVSNSSSGVAKALMAQRANTKAQQESKVQAEKEKYYNPEVKDIKTGDPKLDLLYKNQWLMDVPILGDYIKGKAKEIAELSGGASFVDVKNLPKSTDFTEYTPYKGSFDQNMPSLIDQYFSKKPLYQLSKYKPKSDYLTFLPSYSVKGKADEYLKTDPKTISSEIDIVTGQKDIPEKAYKEFLKNKKPIYYRYEGNNNVSGLSSLLQADLGAHKVGIAWDEEKNLPYISLSDAWDFEPNAYSKKWSGDTNSDAYVQAALLHKAGNPFKIYDRFYFDPKTKKYIPDAEVARRRPSKINTNKQIPVDRDKIAQRLSVFNNKNKK